VQLRHQRGQAGKRDWRPEGLRQNAWINFLLFLAKYMAVYSEAQKNAGGGISAPGIVDQGFWYEMR
jgi:hypothetical protein